MKKPGREYSKAYGVTLDRDLQIVVAERTRAGVQTRTVLQAALGPNGLDDPGRLSPVQADLLAGDATLSAAMPTGNSFTRWLETPFGARRKAVRVLPALLDIQLPFPLEQCVYRFPDIRPSADGSRVRALAVAARKPDIENQIERLQPLGLDPLILEHEALALWNQHQREQAPGSTGFHVIACLGTRRSALILGSGDTFEAAFALGQSADALEEDAGTRAPGGAVDAFLRRARHILQANAPAKDRTTPWTWTGPGAERKGTTGILESALGSETQVAFDTSREPATFLARALATDALDGTAARSNLRSGPLEHASRAGRRRQEALNGATVGVIAGALLCIVGLAGPWTLDHRDRQLQEEITSEAKTLTGMRAVPRGQELIIVEQRLAERRQREAIILRAGEPTASRAMERAVSLAGPAGVTLSGVTARPGFFSVKGVASDRARAEAFAAQLQSEGFNTMLESEDAGGDGNVAFVVKGEASGE